MAASRRDVVLGMLGLASAAPGCRPRPADDHPAAPSPAARGADAPSRESPQHDAAVAVVELFTSEGCSSCPPADDTLAALHATGDPRIHVLSLHVDYWDDLGWPDPYASAVFTERQRAYADAFRKRGVYTPQLVVNGEEELVGSDRAGARAAIARALAHPALSTVVIAATASARGVDVRFQTQAAPDDASIRIALVEPSRETRVRRGENAGKTLRHVRVVRALSGKPLVAPSGTIALPLPPDPALRLDNARVVAFVQRAGGAIVGAAETAIDVGRRP